MSDRVIYDSALSFNYPFEDNKYVAFSDSPKFIKLMPFDFTFDHVVEKFFESVVSFGTAFRKFDCIFLSCDLFDDDLVLAEIHSVCSCSCCSNVYLIVKCLEYNCFIKQRNAYCFTRSLSEFRAVNVTSLHLPKSFDLYEVDGVLSVSYTHLTLPTIYSV